MAKKLGILIIHGMGNPEPAYAEGLIGALQERLGSGAEAVEFKACFWSPILQTGQEATWERLTGGGGEMAARRTRHWIVSTLGDPPAYLSGFFKAGKPAYGEIHQCVRDSLASLAAGLGGAAVDKPLMVLAHSLGSVIISNYIWDSNHGHGVGRDPFERMRSLTSLITYGCNIPIFLPPARPLRCVGFPHPDLPPRLRAVASWKNVYAPYDVLGYPIAGVWDDMQGTVIEDIPLNAGPWPLSATPFSHVMYNRDDEFLSLVSGEIEAVLAVA